MIIGRYEVAGKVFYGEPDEQNRIIHPLTGELGKLTRDDSRSPVSVDEVRVLSPVQPSKIIAIGPGHTNVLPPDVEPPEQPFYFFKPSTTVTHPGDPIVYPPGVDNILYEIELAVVIGKTAHNVREEDAADYILGYTCCNDVTAGSLRRDWGTQKSYYWKAYDTFAPLGPVIATGLDIDGLAMKSRINGEAHADTVVSLIYPPARLLSWISHIMTLHPGDVIATGAAAQADLKPGDVCEIEIEGIGVLRNPVVGG